MSEELDIRPVLAMIREKKGVDFTQYRDTTLRRRLSRRLLVCNCCDIDSYLSHICSCPDEIDRLMADLTIKYSEFFRDSWVYNMIRETVLPSIIADKCESGGTIAIWSAGCATGEEAYSLAVLARQAVDSGRCPLRVGIVGTDVDPAALKVAEAGIYTKDFLPQPLDTGAAAQFEDHDRKLIALPGIREFVEFYQHDLTAASAMERMQDIRPEKFDLVLCRNVLVYLLRETQARVLRVCSEMLRPGGYLVIGTKETLPREMESELVALDKRSGIYRKPLSGTESAANVR